MPNPFYIPPAESGVSRVIDFGTKLQQLKLMGEDQALRGRAQNLAEKEHVQLYGTPGGPPGLKQQKMNLQSRQIGTAEKTAETQRKQFEFLEKKFKADQGLAMSPMQEGDFFKITGTLSMADKEYKTGLEKASKPMVDYIRTMTEQGATRYDIYQAMKGGAWEQFRPRIIENLQGAYNKALNDGDSKQAETIADMANFFASDKFLDQTFPASAVVERKQKAEQQIEMMKATKAGAAMKSYVTPDGKVVQVPGNVAPPPGSTPYSSGMEITTSDGTTIRTGVPGTAGGMQKKVAGDIQTTLKNTNEGLVRISQIMQSLDKPEYLEIPSRLGAAWDKLKTKFGNKIPEENRAFLEGYGVFKRRALENINLYIKEITGAQMSEKEANRIRQAMPDPGEGVFDGDDYITFRKKAEDTYKQLYYANVRYAMYLKQGLDENTIKNLIKSGQVLSIDGTKERIRERYAELEKLNPGMQKEQILDMLYNEIGVQSGR